MEGFATVITVVFGSGAIFSLIGEIILYKMKRRDSKDDETLKEIKHLKQAQKVLMRAEIVRRCKEVLVNGEISFEEREEILELYEAYEKELEGNSRATDYVKQIKTLQIKERSMHKTRKTYATKLINGKVDERIVIKQLGHTDISCTKNFYYFNNKDIEEAKKQIELAVSY